MTEKDNFRISDSERRIFDEQVAGFYPAEVTDGYDPTPRDVIPELEPEPGTLPLGHNVNQGDFDTGV